MKSTSKDDVGGSFNIKRERENFMYTFLNTNLLQFSGNLEGFFGKGKYKKQLKIHCVGFYYHYFNSSDVFMLGHGCGISQFPQFYDRKKLLHPYVGCYEGEKGKLSLK